MQPSLSELPDEILDEYNPSRLAGLNEETFSPIAGAAYRKSNVILSLTGIATMNRKQLLLRGPVVLGLLLVCSAVQAEPGAERDAQATESIEHLSDVKPVEAGQLPAGGLSTGNSPQESPVIPAPPVIGPVDERFAELLSQPYVHMAVAFNSADDACTYWRPCRREGHANPRFTYDPAENAMRLDMTTRGISSKDQLRVYFNELDKSNCEKVSMQWQVKIGDGYDDTGGLQNFKAFQISDRREQLMWEYQWVFLRAKPGAAALPTNRMYRDVSYSEATRQEPLVVSGPELSPVTGRPMINWQPGGETAADYHRMPFGREDHLEPAAGAPYVLPLHQWITYTTDFMFVGNELRVKIWLSDEETPPTLVLDGADGNGFVLSKDTSQVSMAFQNWWIEMNSSQEGGQAVERTLWVKNFIVYKDASVPR